MVRAAMDLYGWELPRIKRYGGFIGRGLYGNLLRACARLAATRKGGKR